MILPWENMVNSKEVVSQKRDSKNRPSPQNVNSRPQLPRLVVPPQVKSVYQKEYAEDEATRILSARDVFFRLDRGEAINPEAATISPHAGVFVFHFPNGFTYLNQAQLIDMLAQQIMTHTRRTTVPEYAHPGVSCIPPFPPTAIL